MSEPSQNASTRFALSDPQRVMAALIDDFAEHARIERGEGTAVFTLPYGRAELRWDDAAASFRVGSNDDSGLAFIKYALVEHVLNLLDKDEAQPRIVWQGDGAVGGQPLPYFRELTVVSVANVTPHMRRLTLSGPDVVRFCPMDALHLNILVQQPGLAAPQWPSVGADGLIAWAEPDKRPAFRKYTVRAVDVAAGTLDIDFVRHADAGPGSDFAETARIGDRLGVAGPGGGGLVETDWYLFAGDETALPAIARMLERLPETASGQAFIEVTDAAEIQPIHSRSNVEITWLTRDGRPAGTTALLPDAIAATLFPVAGTSIYVWVGCEFEAFQTIRAHLRRQRGLKKHEHLAVSYWRRGASG